MNLNKIKLCGMLAMAVFFTASLPQSFAQKTTALITDKAEIGRLVAAVEVNPNDLKAHKAYIDALDVLNPELVKQYDVWIKKYPKSAIVPFVIGQRFTNHESPKAKPYLLKAVAIDPSLAAAWSALSSDGERWGKFEEARTYLGKAVAAAPDNADYAFYYASSFSAADKEKYKMLSLDFVAKFPEHQRAAQALYWLANKTVDKAEKIGYYERMHKNYPASKYNWSVYGMSDYFNLLLSSDPKKAIALATEMAAVKELEKEWSGLLTAAKGIAEAKELMDQKKGAEALAVLEQVKLSRYGSGEKNLLLWKAQANDIAGNTTLAYEDLVSAFVKAPSSAIKEQILFYGKKLDKDAGQVDADIWKKMNAAATPATSFSLKNYFTKSNTSLEDYKGKVVLLTYWFPGCGPCRGEFPHFENVVRKFKGQELAYVGINVVSNQNDYVIPFVKSSGYSFTPLEDVKGRNKGNMDNRGAAPMNFLIDKDGRLVFSNFRTEANNEDELELMISLLLNGKKS